LAKLGGAGATAFQGSIKLLAQPLGMKKDKTFLQLSKDSAINKALDKKCFSRWGKVV
jgi:hypothetical protein